MIYTICHFVLACKRAPSMWVCEKLLHICQELRRYQNLRWRDYASVNSSWMRKFFLLLANAVKSSYDQGEHCLSALFFTFLTCWHVQFLNICAFLFLYKLTSTCRQSWSWKSSQEALEHPWVDLQCHFRWVNKGSVVWFKCLVSVNSSEFSPLISVKVKKSSPKSLSADRWYTVGQLSADSIPTVNQKLPNSMIRINSIALNEISICNV